METLVLFATAPERARDASVAALEGVFLKDLAETCSRWRNQKVAVDQNRRVSLYVERTETPLFVELAERAGARLETLTGGDLAAQLRHAFDAEFERGARAVCAISSDCPSLPVHLLDEAFRALVWERVVFGPTFDASYWLVGAQRPAPDVFRDLHWGSAGALQKSVQALQAAGQRPHLLPFWYRALVDLEHFAWHARTVRGEHPDTLRFTWPLLVERGLLREARS